MLEDETSSKDISIKRRQSIEGIANLDKVALKLEECGHALSKACVLGNIEDVQKLLNDGTDVNLLDKVTLTLLIFVKKEYV